MSDDTESNDDTALWRTADRKRGILTESDRKYLLGETELNGQSERNKRLKIRERAIQSMLDVVLLMEELEKRDEEQIFHNDMVSNRAVWGNLVFASFTSICYNIDHIDELESEIENVVEKSIIPLPGGSVDKKDDKEVFTPANLDPSVSVEITAVPMTLESLFAEMGMSTDDLSEEQKESVVEEINSKGDGHDIDLEFE